VAELEGIRHGFGFETDGAVLKLDARRLREWVGYTSRAPKWARAYKYAPEQAATVLKDITIQVGRTGVLTPVAELEPVFLSGSQVSRATLHNEDEIRRKDIRIGDTVLVEKAGEVIPAVAGVVRERRPASAQPFDFLERIQGRCPACGGPVERNPDFVAWECRSPSCPAQKTRRLEYFAGRGALDLEGIGGIVADKLVETGLVDEPLDLFSVPQEALAALNLGTETEPRVFGAKNATKVGESLARARTLPLARWIHALAIPEVGETTAYDLARFHSSLEALADSPVLRDVLELQEARAALQATRSSKKAERDAAADQRLAAQLRIDAAEQRLESAGFGKRTARKTKGGGFVTETGPVVAAAVLEYFGSAAGRRVLERLNQLGLTPGQSVPTAETAASGLAGKTLVLTGTLASLSRTEAAERIRAAGGSVTGKVTGKTDFLVAGENGGSKLEDAAALGVPVLDEAAFLALLGAPPESGSGSDTPKAKTGAGSGEAVPRVFEQGELLL
jgi:DNA ligase (NAD+)